MAPPNPGVLRANPHALQIQADKGCQVTLASGGGKRICPRPRPYRLCLGSFLFSAACRAAAFPCCSCFKELLPYLHSSDQFENSFSSRVKNPPWSRLRFLLLPHLVSRRDLPRGSYPATLAFAWLINFLQSFIILLVVTL